MSDFESTGCDLLDDVDVDSSSDLENDNDDFANIEHSSSCKKAGGKSRYKHVPHSQKPPQVVEKRNARERKRVQTVNSAFTKLRKYIPYENRHKRLSKVKTLHKAIEYINHLKTLIDSYDEEISEHVAMAMADTIATQQQHQQQATAPLCPDLAASTGGTFGSMLAGVGTTTTMCVNPPPPTFISSSLTTPNTDVFTNHQLTIGPEDYPADLCSFPSVPGPSSFDPKSLTHHPDCVPPLGGTEGFLPLVPLQDNNSALPTMTFLSSMLQPPSTS